jgi:hypothetical protein
MPEVEEAVAPVDEFKEKADAFLDEHFAQEAQAEAETAAAPAVDTAAPDTGAAASPEEPWLTDDLKATAKTYGLDDDDIESYGSEAQLRASMRVLDKQLRSTAREHYGQKPEETKPPENKGVASPAPTVPTPPAQTKGMEGVDQYLTALEKEYGADEPVTKALRGIRDEIASKVSSQEQQIAQAHAWIAQEQQARQQQAANAEAHQFAAHICKSHPELFGEDYSRATPEQQNQANKAFQAYLEIKYGIGLRNGSVPEFSQTLVDRALHSEFHDHFKTKAQKDLSAKVKKSAAQRMGGAPRRQVAEPFQGDVGDDPQLKEVFERMKQDPTLRLNG